MCDLRSAIRVSMLMPMNIARTVLTMLLLLSLLVRCVSRAFSLIFFALFLYLECMDALISINKTVPPHLMFAVRVYVWCRLLKRQRDIRYSRWSRNLPYIFFHRFRCFFFRHIRCMFMWHSPNQFAKYTFRAKHHTASASSRTWKAILPRIYMNNSAHRETRRQGITPPVTTDRISVPKRNAESHSHILIVINVDVL